MGTLPFRKRKIENSRTNLIEKLRLSRFSYQGCWAVDELKDYTYLHFRWREGDPALGGILCSSNELAEICSLVDMPSDEFKNFINYLAEIKIIDAQRWQQAEVIYFIDDYEDRDGLSRCIEHRQAMARGGRVGAGKPKIRSRRGFTDWMYRDEMAEHFGISTQTVSRWAIKGKLESKPCGRKKLYRAALSIVRTEDSSRNNGSQDSSLKSGKSTANRGGEAVSLYNINYIPYGGSAEGGAFSDMTSDTNVAPAQTDNFASEATTGTEDWGMLVFLAESMLKATPKARNKTKSSGMKWKITVKQWTSVLQDLLNQGASLSDLKQLKEAYINEPEKDDDWVPNRLQIGSLKSFRKALKGNSIKITKERWEKSQRRKSAASKGYNRFVGANQYSADSPLENLLPSQEQDMHKRLPELYSQFEEIEHERKDASGRELDRLTAERRKVVRDIKFFESLLSEGGEAEMNMADIVSG